MPESRQLKLEGNPVRKRFSSLLALVLLAVVAGVCISLGFWQLDRAAQRDALNQQIEHGRTQAPIVLTASTPTESFLPWRAATAQGRWSDEHTVLLQNRNLDGRPGYWVATPLLLAPPSLPVNRLDAVTAGSAESEALTGSDSPDFLSRGPVVQAPAVLVLRGWLPRDMTAGEAAPAIPSEAGVLQIRGELHSHVPRIFELWQWAGGASSQMPAHLPLPDGAIAQVQNIDLDAYAQATGLDLLPVVLAQTDSSGGPQTDLRREWPGPSLDSDQNRGYALQWFGFSSIAIIAALFVLVGLFRRDNRSTKQ